MKRGRRGRGSAEAFGIGSASKPASEALKKTQRRKPGRGKKRTGLAKLSQCGARSTDCCTSAPKGLRWGTGEIQIWGLDLKESPWLYRNPEPRASTSASISAASRQHADSRKPQASKHPCLDSQPPSASCSFRSQVHLATQRGRDACTL